MKKAILERNLVVILFILVLIVFSLAERDSKKLEKIYGTASQSIELEQKNNVASIPALPSEQ